jgi:murein DD-endopeptidase MepM/ murein hydrolase activator NlpD
MQIQRFLSKFRYVNIYNPEYLRVDYPQFSSPVDMKIAYISQLFGVNPRDYYPMKGHDGIDYGLSVGSAVRAPIDMTITDLILQKNSYGRHAIAKDVLGHRQIFGHLHEWQCSKGDFIKRGQQFALSGGDLADPYHGYSSGPHLHWEWRPAWANQFNGYGGAENQLPYITFGDVIYPTPKAFMIVNVKNPNGATLGLNVRNNKGKGPAIGSLEPGQEVEIFEISTVEAFGKIDPYADKWIALVSAKRPYVEVKKFINKE